MSAYYNEIDPYAAQWLRNLIAGGHIAPGEVDVRDIRQVLPEDVKGFTQCHFFAGIAGWSLALRLAGWPDDRPVWTGSCPCKPFSSAARGRNKQGESKEHLWPYWKLLVSELAPSVIFGEQVADAGTWLDNVCDDLEELGYSFGATILPACSVGFDHARPRIYFVGNSDREGEPSRPFNAEVAGVPWDNSQHPDMGPQNGFSARVATLRSFGNAIVPQVAAEFIRATMP
jgi:DNA (cytosine-5)-methyltransferase 1